MLLSVKGKVLEIDSKKILRPDPGLYSQYFASYDIFCEPQIFRHPIFNLFNVKLKILPSQKKWHNSESIVSTDLGQVSKFSLIRYLKLFPRHQKYLASRKKPLDTAKKRNVFFRSPFSCFHFINCPSSSFMFITKILIFFHGYTTLKYKS